MNIILQSRRAVALAFVTLAISLWFVQTAPSHADVSASASSTLPGMGAVPQAVDVFDIVRRGSALTSTGASSVSTTVPTIPNILNTIPDVGAIIAGASSTGTSTSGLGSSIVDTVNSTLGSTTLSGLGAQIAAAITGGATGTGTSDIGPFIKCVLIAPIGWPLPTYSTECNATTTNKARLTIIKNTVGGNGTFGFTISGSASASTSITTSSGTGTVQFLASPGTFDITELTQSGWVQSSRGCRSQAASSTGGVSGTLGWSVLLQAGDDIVCTFVNSATSTATTTNPGGGGGCVENCGGGGGCVANCGSGGGNPAGGVSGGGGGGNGPVSTTGPILGGGGFSPGQVLGNTIDIPGVPNTGAGGSASSTYMLLLASLALAVCGTRLARKV